MPVRPVPEGRPRVSPYLIVDDAAGVIDFMVRVFDAEVLARHLTSDGRVMHAEVRVVDSVVMVGGANAQWPAVPAALHIYVEDVDAAHARAVAAGATSLEAPVTKFYGDRSTHLVSPGGVTWFITTHVEDVTDDEMERRMNAAQAGA